MTVNNWDELEVLVLRGDLTSPTGGNFQLRVRRLGQEDAIFSRNGADEGWNFRGTIHNHGLGEWCLWQEWEFINPPKSAWFLEEGT